MAVHQVAALKQLGRPGTGQPAWAALMAKKRRKTLIVCAPCHERIHADPCHADGISRWRARCGESRTPGVRREALRRIPYSAGRNSEEMFLGHLAYLAGKPGGDKSMPGTRRPSGGVQGGVPLDPHGMAKAGLLEAQSPAVNVRTHRNDAWNRCRVMSRHEPVGRGTLRDAEHRPARAVEEMSGRPNPCSIRTTRTYRGIAYGARALRRRSARSSQRPGKPVTRRRGTGGQ